MQTLTDRFAFEACASAWKPEDKSTASEWGRRHVVVPGSARATSFNPDVSPWLIEPMNLIPDDSNKEVVIMMPTGGGKTTIFDVLVPRVIAEAGGSIILTQQTQKEADDHWASRVEPTLLGIDRIARQIRNLPRDKKRKGTIILPGQTLYCIPANETEAQRKSVRFVFIDEAWQIKHGLIQQFRARTHDRWNQRVVIVSQGGCTHVLDNNALVPSELAAAWERTDQREFSMVCPDCGIASAWSNHGLIYEDQPDATMETLDENAILESARYRCKNCETEFADKIDIRRALATASIYVPANPKPLAQHVGFHTTAHALYYIAWGQLALEWKKASLAAKHGDPEARKIYIQKRLAQNWREDTQAPDIVLSASNYSINDYLVGEMVEGEFLRAMTIDRQQGEKGDIPHFWVRVRAWRADGSSRGLVFRRCNTIEDVRALQLRYKVKDEYTIQDAANEGALVFDDCIRFGWRAFIGTKYSGFAHLRKGRKSVERLYSERKRGDGVTQRGHAFYFLLATDKLKDILASLISGRETIFEHALDEGDDYTTQMRGEIKKPVMDKVTKRISLRWVKLNSRTPNHAWDCEVYQVAVAIMLRLLRRGESDEDGAIPIDTPAEEAA